MSKRPPACLTEKHENRDSFRDFECLQKKMPKYGKVSW
jgi:hypothetical protein